MTLLKNEPEVHFSTLNIEPVHISTQLFLSNLCAGFSAIYGVFDSLLQFGQKTLTLTFRDRSQFRGAGRG